MARPSLYSEELRARVTTLISRGCDELDAFILEGVSRRTFFEWKAQAKQEVEPFAELFEAVEQAAAQRNVRLTLLGVKAANAGDMQTCFKMLRAYRPDLYGEKSRVELTGQNGGPLQTSVRYVVHVPPEEPEEQEP